ncbi:hypothetical protein ACWEVD_22605 [Nocardia thailandica]
MSTVALVIRDLHGAENDLATLLLDVADRHRADHEIHHLARDLAGWSHDHVQALAGAGRAYGLELAPVRRPGRAVADELDGGPHRSPGLLLLHDLREIHCAAAGVSIDWEILAQAAQALRDDELLGVVTRCHPRTLRQMRWADAQVKANAAQIVVAT